jgi:hypothetical protein
VKFIYKLMYSVISLISSRLSRDPPRMASCKDAGHLLLATGVTATLFDDILRFLTISHNPQPYFGVRSSTKSTGPPGSVSALGDRPVSDSWDNRACFGAVEFICIDAPLSNITGTFARFYRFFLGGFIIISRFLLYHGRGRGSISEVNGKARLSIISWVG